MPRWIVASLCAGMLTWLGGCASTGTPDAGMPDAGSSASASANKTASAGKPAGKPVAPAPVPAPVATAPTPPAPIVVAPSPPPAPAPAAVGSIWDRIRKGFAMPELDTPLVAEKERFYLGRPELLQRMFARGAPYLYYIVDEAERRGMPTELALLPFVESAMNPSAVSPAQAAGLWQFIPSTGKTYNLSQNWWVDNRRDVVHSTQAAFDYLQTIYAMHGNDWFLALASYNWGENAVARAVQRNQAAGLSTDYLSLRMPNETRHYVPKLIALKNIVANASQLGVALPEVPNKPYFVTIEKTRPIDLKLAAQFAGMSVDEFVALNPAHNRPVIAASKNNEIKLPADRLDRFLEAVERHGEANRPFASWQPYTMQSGDTIESVAQRGGVSVEELMRANSLKSRGRLLAGTRIIAPTRKGIEDERRIDAFKGTRLYEAVSQPAVYHRVGRHETMASIAHRYGVSVATLGKWNGTTHARRGASLMVRPPSSQTLLTDENGNRQVISNEPQIVRVSNSEPAPAVVPAVASPSHAQAQAHPKSHPQKKAATKQRTAAKGTQARTQKTRVAPPPAASRATAAAKASRKAPTAGRGHRT